MPAAGAAAAVRAGECALGRRKRKALPARAGGQAAAAPECVALQLSELMGSAIPAPALPQRSGRSVAGLTLDSRKVQPGFLFAALAGSEADGAAFVADAVKRGASAILAASDAVLPPLDQGIVVLRDANPRRRMALMAAAFAGLQPATIAAVTGTNGKSSTVHFVRHIWASARPQGGERRHAGHRLAGLRRATPD